MIEKWREELSEFEKEILQTTYEYFKENGDWPNSLRMAVNIRKKGNFWKTVEEIGYSFIGAGNPEYKDSKCKLSIFGIALCDGSERDIELFMNFIKVAVKRYIENPEISQVTDEDLRNELSFSTTECIRLIRIFRMSLGEATAGGSYDETNGTFKTKLRYKILDYENINSFEDYIKLNLDNIPVRFGGNLKRERDIFPNVEAYYPEDEIERYIDILDKEERVVEKGYVFILMSMSEEYELKEVNKKIREICKEFNFKAQRVDDIQSSGNITDEILDNIKKAEFIVTDLSKERPNVYYELGYAHGYGLGAYELILIAKEGTKLHFDIRNLRVIYYKDPDDMKKKLRTRFKSLLDVRS